jgi:hypothetical protein
MFNITSLEERLPELKDTSLEDIQEMMKTLGTYAERHRRAKKKVPHASASPSPIMLFLSRRFSSVRSATASFRAAASARSSFTSGAVA